jgi:hypothetical protein
MDSPFIITKRGLTMDGKPPKLLAGSMGLEPTASGVTGRRYNQLNYDPKNIFIHYGNSMLPFFVMRIGQPSGFPNFPGRRNRT